MPSVFNDSTCVSGLTYVMALLSDGTSQMTELAATSCRTSVKSNRL